MSTRPVGLLTDAALAVLSRPVSRVGPLPRLPAWSRLDPEQRAAAVRDARSELVSCGLLDPETPGSAALRRDLRSVLVLRESAGVVVAVARVMPAGADHWFAHVVRDVVLLEQVGDDGVHLFAVAPAAELAALVTAAVLHPETGRRPAPSPARETDWLHAAVEVRGLGPPQRAAWVSGPAGLWRTR